MFICGLRSVPDSPLAPRSVESLKRGNDGEAEVDLITTCSGFQGFKRCEREVCLCNAAHALVGAIGFRLCRAVDARPPISIATCGATRSPPNLPVQSVKETLDSRCFSKLV